MSILREVSKCKNIEHIYDNRTYWNKEGVPCLIKTESSGEIIIADWMEQGLGFRNTTLMVNKNRLDEGRGHVGMIAVRDAFLPMNPVITKINKRMQGSKCNTNW